VLDAPLMVVIWTLSGCLVCFNRRTLSSFCIDHDLRLSPNQGKVFIYKYRIETHHVEQNSRHCHCPNILYATCSEGYDVCLTKFYPIIKTMWFLCHLWSRFINKTKVLLPLT
jgi:hypothetical protein